MKPVRILVVAALAVALSIIASPPGAQAAGSVSSYQQCRNVGQPAGSTACTNWVNGGLNSQNQYAEDGVLPQRVVFNATSTGPNTLTVSYDDLKGGTVHGFDYLATWNASQTSADGCQGLSGAAATVCGGPSTTVAMASDGATRNGGVVSAHEIGVSRLWTIRGGAITNVAAITHDASHGFATITFTANAVGPVIILFGGHLAVGTPSTADRSWGDGLGAHDYPGGSLGMDVGGANNSINTGAVGALPPPNFTITKTASPTATGPGGAVTYTVTVKNTGSQPGSTTFTDTATAGVVPTFAGPTAPSGGSCTAANACTTSTLDPGASQVFTFTATMPSSFSGSPGGSGCTGTFPVNNTATLTGTNSDPVLNTATATVCVSPTASFTITKTASSPTATTGGSITYTVTVKNTGSGPGSTSFTDAASNGVTPTFVSPTTPSGGTCTAALVCTTSTLNPNATQVFTFTATMPTSFTGDPSPACADANGGYRVTNTATLSGGGSDTAGVCVAASAGFSITKTASSPTADVNGSITYTVTVKNTGTATGSTSFTDSASNGVTPTFVGPTVPSGGSCTAANVCTTTTLDPGATQAFTFTATMPASFTGPPSADCATSNGGYKVTNTATLASNGGSDTAPVCVAAAATFSITKTASSDTAGVNDPITYTVTVENTGTAPGTTQFTDTASNGVTPTFAGPTDPSGGSCTAANLCTTSSLDPGATQEFTFTATMPASFTGPPGPLDCLTHPGSYAVSNTAAISEDNSSTATVCVAATADFSILKEASSDTAGPGDPITYTVTVTNTGSATGSTSFTDDYNDAATPQDPLPDGCFDSSVTDNDTFTCTTGPIDPGKTQVFSYVVTMPSSFSGTPAGCDNGGFPVVNSVTITDSAESDEDAHDSTKVCVTAAPDFSVSKLADSSTSTAGGVVGYTVVVTNNGSGPGSASFTDDYDDAASPVLPLPDGCSDSSTANNKKFTCDTESIDPGDNQVFHYSITMPPSFSGTPSGCINGGFQVVNLVTLEGGGSDTATVCVTTAPDFSITKHASSSTAGAGDTVHYTVVVSNDGTGPGTTTFTDDYNDDASPVLPLPDGCTDTTSGDDKQFTCDTESIDPGDSQTFEYDVTMPETFSGTPSGCDNGGFPVVNSVTLEGDAGDDSATVCVTTSPDFTVTKTADSTTANAGDPVGYTVVVTNNGSGPGSTRFTDDYNDDASPVLPLPDGCQDTSTATNDKFGCDTESIDPGKSQTYHYAITMPTSFSGGAATCDGGGFAVVNTVTITGGSSTDSETVCVATEPDFDVTKTAGSTTAGPGEVVHYTVVVSNDGTGPGTTSFTDDYNDDASPVLPLPDGCSDSSSATNKQFTCDTESIDPGDSQTFEYDVTMPETFSGTASGCDDGGFPVVNSVTLAGDAGDDSATVCVTTSPDFTVTKTAAAHTAEPGNPVEYTVVVTNNGSGPGTTSFTDDYNDDASPVLPLPDGCSDSSSATNKKFSCDTEDIDPGKSQTFTYSITMPTTFTGSSDCDGGYAVVNTVTVEAGGSTDGDTVCVTAAPDLSVTKSVDPTDPGPGDEVTYTVTVTNNGTAPGSTTVIDDYDQEHVTLGDHEGCADDGDVLTCDTGTIEAGDQVEFVYTATITDAFTGEPDCDLDGVPGYTVSNTATIPGADGAPVDICVPAAPDFSIEKSVDPTTAQPGDTVHYTIVVTNSGDAAGSDGFVDNFDDRVDADLPSGSLGGTCSLVGTDDPDDDAMFSCLTGTIAAHSSETFEYDAVLPDSFGSDDARCEGGGFSVSNVATLVSGGAEDPADVCVTAAPLFHVEKSADDTSAKPGQDVEYTIVVTNDGTAPGSTTFTDNYADVLDDSITAPEGCSKDDLDGDLVLSCETETIEPGESQTFTYTATMPEVLSGSKGDCADGSYPIVNSVTVDVSDDDNGDSVTICVPAKPHFQITKTVDDADAVPGQTIHYTVTVSNDGNVATSTTFTDTITPALARTHVPADCEVAGGVLTCTTDEIQPGDSQVFEYDVTMPATYTGDSGGGGCDPGEFPVSNTATITSGEHGDPASKLVCVTAAPALHVHKSVEKSVSTDSTVLTYTIDYSNTGPAEARHTVLTDPIPDGTTFVSCTGCTHGGTPDTATWDIGNVAPLTGSGTVTLVVKVTGKQACSVSNTAQIDAADVDPVSSNTTVTEVTPPSDPTGANAHGSGAGAQVLTAGLVNLLIGNAGAPIGYSESSQTGPGGPVIDSDSVLSAKVPSNGNLVKVGLVNTSSASAVNGSPIAARQLSTAEVANVCLFPVSGVCTVEASALRSVAATLANGTTVGTSSAGSSIANLKIAGLGTPVDMNSTTKITLNPLVFGPGSYVAINEHQSTTGLKDGKLYADMTTTMIHLKVTGLLKLQSVEIVVGQAKAHSEFLKTFECNPNANSVSGHAYVAGVNTGPLQTNVIQGFVGMGPKGGGSEQHLVAVVLPANGGLVKAAVADSRTQGTVTGTSADSFSVAEVAGAEGAPACVVRTSPTQCLVEAVVVRSEARSHADQTNGSVSTSANTKFVGLKVLGLPVDVNVPPNTTINLPGIGYVVLNEQTCDGGGLAVNGSCAGYPHSGITVRAVHVVVTVLGNVLGLQPAVQVVVAEAHADSTVF